MVKSTSGTSRRSSGPRSQSSCTSCSRLPRNRIGTMTITVVIPTLNEEVVLPRTLSQTIGIGFDELIVVDGGSHDRTREIVTALRVTREASPVTLLTAPPGRARQMNAGGISSKGDVLLFLHADTSLPSDARQAVERALEDPACVGGRVDMRFERDQG